MEGIFKVILNSGGKFHIIHIIGKRFDNNVCCRVYTGMKNLVTMENLDSFFVDIHQRD